MAKYRYFIQPGTFKKHPKQYTLVDGDLIALHLETGTEEVERPGNRKRPPEKVIAKAANQAVLEKLFSEKHPFVTRQEILENAGEQKPVKT